MPFMIQSWKSSTIPVTVFSIHQKQVTVSSPHPKEGSSSHLLQSGVQSFGYILTPSSLSTQVQIIMTQINHRPREPEGEITEPFSRILKESREQRSWENRNEKLQFCRAEGEGGSTTAYKQVCIDTDLGSVFGQLEKLGEQLGSGRGIGPNQPNQHGSPRSGAAIFRSFLIGRAVRPAHQMLWTGCFSVSARYMTSFTALCRQEGRRD